MTQQVIWNLPVPLDEKLLARTGPQPTLVQFAGGAEPSERDHRLLGSFLASRPATAVRFYGAHLRPDLQWLSHYADARRINLDVNAVDSFEPLRTLSSELDELTLGKCGTRRHSLAPLAHFRALRSLMLVGNQKEIEVVGRITSLERLTLVSLKLPDLQFLTPLKRLRAFELKLGGTTNLDALPEVGRVQYLEIWRVNGLTDLSVVRRLPELEYLFLQHLKRVEQLPPLDACQRLRRIHIDRVGIHDLAAIAMAPRLEELLLLDMPQLEEEKFRVLVGHPSLRAVTAGVRNEKRRASIRAMLQLDDVDTYGTDFQFSPSPDFTPPDNSTR